MTTSRGTAFIVVLLLFFAMAGVVALLTPPCDSEIHGNTIPGATILISGCRAHR